MNKIVGFAFLAFAITGLLMTSSMSDSFAAKGGNGSDNANTQSCLKDTKKNPEKNPNCGGTNIIDTDEDGISDADELAYPCPQLANGTLDPHNVDSDGDNVWDGDEIDHNTNPCDSGDF